MIRITSKQDGFRRCGIAHSRQPAEYPDKAFSREQLEILQAEPLLTVELIADAGKTPTAEELIAQIKTAETVAAIDAILGEDKRKTVVAAAEARKAELAGKE